MATRWVVGIVGGLIVALFVWLPSAFVLGKVFEGVKPLDFWLGVVLPILLGLVAGINSFRASLAGYTIRGSAASVIPSARMKWPQAFLRRILWIGAVAGLLLLLAIPASRFWCFYWHSYYGWHVIALPGLEPPENHLSWGSPQNTCIGLLRGHLTVFWHGRCREVPLWPALLALAALTWTAYRRTRRHRLPVGSEGETTA